MRLFLSYAHEQKEIARAITAALRGDGHEVFFDGAALQPGAGFDKVIREEVAKSEAFVFLVSPESIEPGSYARTELRFALERWRSGERRIIPVLVAPVRELPRDLRLTLLEPQGDLVAEVAREVDTLGRELSRKRWRNLGAPAAVVGASLIAIVAFASRSSRSIAGKLEPPGLPSSAGASSERPTIAALSSSASPSLPAVPAPQLDKLTALDVAVGHASACAVRSDHRVVCWANLDEQGKVELGNAVDPARPKLIANIDDADQITGDDGNWCVRSTSGGVKCWSPEMPWAPSTPLRSLPIGGAVEIASSCARLADGKIVSWSDGAPKGVTGVSDAKAIGRTSGGTYCVVREDKTVACWGGNGYGQLGDGTRESRESPVTARGIRGADQVASSLFFGTCALLAWKVRCWGGEVFNQGFEPKEAAGISDAVQVELAEYHGCVRLSDGRLSCWGANGSGQLGRPSEENEAMAPAVVKGISDIIDVRLGGGEPCGGCGSTCVRSKDGELICWGGLTGGYEPRTFALHEQ
jgi:hypothetical protein